MFFFSNHIDFVHIIDDYIRYSKKSISLYKYIENYLDYYEKIKQDNEIILMSKGMESRLGKYYNNNLYYYLDILYYHYTLNTEPPYMFVDHSFMTFCNNWYRIYTKHRLRRAEKAIIPAQKKFLDRYWDPRTKIGQKRLNTSFEKLQESCI